MLRQGDRARRRRGWGAERHLFRHADILLSNDLAGPPQIRAFKIATRAPDPANPVTIGLAELAFDPLFVPTGTDTGVSVGGSD